MRYQSYKDLEIHQIAHKLAIEVHRMSLTKLPKFEMYEEGQQIRKSSKSVANTIVEGFGRRRYKNEFILFLTYALASCDETREHLDTLFETESLKDKESYDYFVSNYDVLGKKLTKFIQAIEQGHLTPKARIQNPGSRSKNPESRIEDQGSRIKKTPQITADIIIELEDRGIVLIKRKNPPVGWALPGGFLDYGESLEDCAIREAKEETSLDIELKGQFHTYSTLDRDPRWHTVTMVFVATSSGAPKAATDASEIGVFKRGEIPEDLVFDHNKILEDYFKYKNKGEQRLR